MATLAWLVAFTVVQILLLGSANHCLAALRPRRSLAARAVRWGLGVATGLGVVILVLPGGHGPRYESRAQGHLRAFAAAQHVFRANAGVYGNPVCLASPARCVPGWPSGEILDPDVLQDLERRLRYSFKFHPGRTVTSAAGVSGPETYAYVAVPVDSVRHLPSYCIDSTGLVVLAAPPVTMPAVTGGTCPAGLPAAN